MSETQTRAIVFRCQFKGDRRRARSKGLPGIAETIRRLTHEYLANFEPVRCPRKSDLSPGAQIDLGFHKKPVFQIFFRGQSLEDALWTSFDKQFFLKCSTHHM